MIVTVQKFREYVNTDLTHSQIKEKLSAFESLIRARTNNNFQRRNRRCNADIVNGEFVFDFPSFFKEGDTIEISDSEYNNGLYVVGETTEDLIDENAVTVTKIVYPPDVQMGAIECLKWQLKNELQNNGTENMPIKSETLSRHTVTYGEDTTETDIDATIGVPRKLTAFLIPYIKARF